MRRTHLLVLATIAGGVACSSDRKAGAARGTAVLIVGEQATTPIPTLMEGKQSTTANSELSDLLFLRLAALGPEHATNRDDGFVPELARSWTRPDSLTLLFELNPAARWQDGHAVTSADVVYSFRRARDAAISPSLAGALRFVDSVSAPDSAHVRVHFSRAYGEQLYDATRHVQPLPAHLLAGLSEEQLRASDFVRNPVGNGPYRLIRNDGSTLIELAANDSFFLGRPGIGRVVLRTAKDADARINLMLSGEGDALPYAIPPLANAPRLTSGTGLRLVSTPSNTVAYLLFNERDRADTSKPHPILSDARVRRALVMALDRQSMARAVYGEHAHVPYGPVSPYLWIARGSPAAAAQDVSGARKLLADAGWRDSDRDGTLDRRGKPLQLELMLPASSAARKQVAALVQEQLRQAGVRLILAPVERPVQGERRAKGDFDIEFSGAGQDPTPSGLTQSWSCRGGSNVAHYCDRAVDSLIQAAILARDGASDIWQRALATIEADAPAAFMYAPDVVAAVSSRYDDVDLRAESAWIRVWRWKVRPGAEIARDRVTAR